MFGRGGSVSVLCCLKREAGTTNVLDALNAELNRLNRLLVSSVNVNIVSVNTKQRD